MRKACQGRGSDLVHLPLMRRERSSDWGGSRSTDRIIRRIPPPPEVSSARRQGGSKGECRRAPLTKPPSRLPYPKTAFDSSTAVGGVTGKNRLFWRFLAKPCKRRRGR
jgi:hypothetical protein